jgi:hypothetical protein
MQHLWQAGFARLLFKHADRRGGPNQGACSFSESSLPDVITLIIIIRSLRPPHPHHALAAEVGILEHMLASVYLNDPCMSVLALKAVVSCRDEIIKFHSKSSADLCEFLGASLLISNMVEQAQEAYCRAGQTLMITHGPSHSYCKIVAEKLLDVQTRFCPDDFVALMDPDSCSFCGGTPPDGGKLERCSRCWLLRYCYREHQALQWPVHKKTGVFHLSKSFQFLLETHTEVYTEIVNEQVVGRDRHRAEDSDFSSGCPNQEI